ncbi:branched-chain amino acid ABC transporter permease [Acidisphaera sp. L21]|uniref:branched-chain amino acid ABC transporter permease n=1 Tax=Acidisphaera sp. L21 TaxID=1641851 RepID=UPI00131B7532|nr:branched-chain amino acid ABC transporter permease [Acidisphaera sp. L21]
MEYFYSYLILASIFVVLGLATNLLVGIAGIFSVSQAAIFGVGAYVTAYCLVNEVMGFLPAVACAAGACLLLNIVITLPALRVAGDYFVVTSFGIQLLATAAFLNWNGATGGASGMAAIPPADLFGYAIEDTGSMLLLCVAAMLLCCLAFYLAMNSPYGRLLRAIREDELAVAASGKPVIPAKAAAAALAGVFGGVAGSLYATFLSFIDPSSFDLNASVLLLSMVVVGGARTLAGSIIGPFVLLALPQVLTMVEIPSTMAAGVRQGLYGALLIAFMLFRPQGLAGQKL